jgi:hypothetical protein
MLTDSGLQSAASFLLSDLKSNGCQAVAKTSVSDFQSAFNTAGGSPRLAVDGLYGPKSSAALQSVITASGGANVDLAGETAPAGCVNQGGGGGPIVVPPVVVSTAGGGTGALPYLVGAIVIAGAFAAYTYSKKHHRRR